MFEWDETEDLERRAPSLHLATTNMDKLEAIPAQCARG
jgi:hypothetical protein